MESLELQLLGTGDAFGSGGRFHTCFLLRSADGFVSVDCGASSLIAMKRAGLDPAEVGWVLLTHLHGDHFGGLPFLILDGQFSRRERPLVIAGPAGVRDRVETAMEVFFPSSSRAARRFTVDFIEFRDGEASLIGPVALTPSTVEHASGAPAYALRVECDGRVIAYSGDTHWTENLKEVARGADLFLCEAYFFEKSIKFHLDYKTLRSHLAELECKRVLLTHMSKDMLRHLDDVDIEHADDGQIISL